MNKITAQQFVDTFGGSVGGDELSYFDYNPSELISDCDTVVKVADRPKLISPQAFANMFDLYIAKDDNRAESVWGYARKPLKSSRKGHWYCDIGDAYVVYYLIDSSRMQKGTLVTPKGRKGNE